MRKKNDVSIHLATLAVFRDLYDNKKDVYGVISEFLNEIIETKGKHNFNLQEITNLLNQTYDFMIPDSVVRASLGRLKYLDKNKENYSVSKNKKTTDNIVGDLQRSIKTSNDKIISELFAYIELMKQAELLEEEKEKVVHSFCSFLLDDANGESYSEYISAFFIKNKADAAFSKQLNKIREGVILYTGLKYTNDLNELGSWKTELTIYLETELLFNFAGFDGEVYKMRFNDFLSYVNEINLKANSKIIKLRYFNGVKNDIDRFFAKAKHIVEGKDIPNLKGSAMNSIIDGCMTSSDVNGKKADFYLLLKNNWIEEEVLTKPHIFDKENYQYNILDKNTIETLSAKLKFDIAEPLKYLNFINIYRQNAHSKNFENIRFILLTGDSKTIKLAMHESIKAEGVVPLATTLNWIINKFWFKLNKGFGKGAFPKTFDILTKAQVLLSKNLNESVGEKYNELVDQYKAGKLTEEQVKGRIVQLKAEVKLPEEIEEKNVASILNVISEDSLERFIQEQEYFKNEAVKSKEENKSLKITLESEKAKNKEITLNSKIESLENSLKQKFDTKLALEKQRSSIELKVEKKYKFFKLIWVIIILIYCTAIPILEYRYNCEPLNLWLLEYIPPCFFLIYLFYSEKTFNPIEYCKRKKVSFLELKNRQEGYNEKQLIEINQEIDSLNSQINDLKLNRGI